MFIFYVLADPTISPADGSLAVVAEQSGCGLNGMQFSATEYANILDAQSILIRMGLKLSNVFFAR